MAINATINLMLLLSLQSHCHLSHIRIAEKISLHVLDAQLRFCDLAKWYGTYPVDPVMISSGNMSSGLFYMSGLSASKTLGVVKWL